MTFRPGDLIPLNDAAELIDSAQGCARLMAECCAAKDAEIAELTRELDYFQRNALKVSAAEVGYLDEIARLREAICEWSELDNSNGVNRNMDWPMYEKACEALHAIAREGK